MSETLETELTHDRDTKMVKVSNTYCDGSVKYPVDNFSKEDLYVKFLIVVENFAPSIKYMVKDHNAFEEVDSKSGKSYIIRYFTERTSDDIP